MQASRPLTSEDSFINEIHDKLSDLRELVTLSNELALLISYDQERTALRGTSSSASFTPATQLSGKDVNYQMKRTADNYLRLGQVH